MGLSSLDVKPLSVGAKQMLETLSAAETMFWEHLKCISNSGQVLDVREAAISLALIQSFQTSLAKDCASDARVAVGLLGTIKAPLVALQITHHCLQMHLPRLRSIVS
jgi:separase